MGQALIGCAGRNPEIAVVGTIDLGDDLREIIQKADVVVDFSSPGATAAVAGICAENKKALVIGTTGHSDAEREFVRVSQTNIPVVWSANYSTGVNALFWLTRKAVEVLGPDFDIEVVEMHHRMKKDAPSGTAATLGEILAVARGQQLAKSLRHGRQGITGERGATEIGMHSLRGGDVVGDHTVVFAANGERLELTHRASSRDTFANGALRAAQWVVNQEPGLYTMQDVLGLK
jgi:4-hydroxy-tetrahydrodipicolinate reductase